MDSYNVANHRAQLRKVLGVMFPPSYIQLYHQPPHSVCSLFTIRQAHAQQRRSENDGVDDSMIEEQSSARLSASTEPSSRAQVLNLQDQLNESLAGHRAKPVGLCPIRRAIYDQCFDEIIRQVTVGCIEQGLILFRIRNELRMTISCYRRLYESSIAYGINKSFDAGLQTLRAENSFKDGKAKTPTLSHVTNVAKHNEGKTGHEDSHEEIISRLKDYYETELAKKDEIISQQRGIMQALNLSSD